MISESACKAQLRHHDRQDVVIYSALLIHVLPNNKYIESVFCGFFVIFWHHCLSRVRVLLCGSVWTSVVFIFLF